MPYLSQPDPGPGFAPFELLELHLGFVPNLFRAQTLVPRLLEAQCAIAQTVLLGPPSPGGLTRVQKERMVLALAASLGSAYCVTAHHHLLRSMGEPEEELEALATDPLGRGAAGRERPLFELALGLAADPSGPVAGRVTALRDAGFADEAILDAVLLAALARFLCCLASGLGPEPDFRPPAWLGAKPALIHFAAEGSGPDTPVNGPDGHFPLVSLSPADFPPFRFFQERFGFVPRIFRAQGLRPDVVRAEAEAVRLVLLTEDILARARKENLLLAVSALNLNTYCVAVHCEMLRALGVDEAQSERVALNHHEAGLEPSDVALLDHAIRLAGKPGAMGPDDVAALLGHGFTQPQVLEAIVMVALTQFLNTLQAGLGVEPDFPPRPRLSFKSPQPVKPGGGEVSPMEDEDRLLVRRVQSGDLEAFESLVRRHDRRVYRTLIGVLGGPEEAEDALQNVFLKVYSHIGDFRGEARFSTWLTRIAINEGLMRLRSRRPTESFDEVAGPREAVGRDLRAWEDDPERICSRGEMRALVEKELARLPAPYRLAVMLRDIEQLSTEEAAAAMSVPVPTLKTRLFRGRLMLRDALAPHFESPGKGGVRA
jgi:RNA polymerase sigma-70 factor (ECF subfamily)